MMRPGIAGAGCALLDILYPDARIESDAFARYRSRYPGDGGLVPGHLVFASALEAYAGVPVDQVIEAVTGDAKPSSNLGGPAIVALVLAAQLLSNRSIPVRYFGDRGDDEIGETMHRIVEQTPLDITGFRRRHGESPSTKVLSDPTAADGSGERTFINDLGVAADFRARDIPAAFYEYEIAYLGGTGLVPQLHAEMGEALRRARESGALTVVATVYDFFNESRAPDALWPLGDGQRDYPYIDLLITDAEEARRLSGESDPAAAVHRFIEWGVGAAIVTSGGDPVWFGVSDRTEHARFVPTPVTSLPASAEVAARAPDIDPASRDTTGCGDNFAGGVLASIATQFEENRAGGADTTARTVGHTARTVGHTARTVGHTARAGHTARTVGHTARTVGHTDTTTRVDLREAVISGIAAGAAAWFQLGGVRIEAYPGEVRDRIEAFRAAYRVQIGEA